MLANAAVLLLIRSPYKMVEEDMKDKYFGIKDAITKMPSWPDRGSIKMINEIVVVKLGSIKGAPLFFE